MALTFWLVHYIIFSNKSQQIRPRSILLWAHIMLFIITWGNKLFSPLITYPKFLRYSFSFFSISRLLLIFSVWSFRYFTKEPSGVVDYWLFCVLRMFLMSACFCFIKILALLSVPALFLIHETIMFDMAFIYVDLWISIFIFVLYYSRFLKMVCRI